MASGGRIESWTLSDAGIRAGPGRSKNLLQWAKQSPPPVVTRPDPGDSPPPAPPVPPQQPTETVDTTPKVVSTVSIPALTSKALQMAAPPPSLPEPPPLPAKPTKPSKWWMLLLIIPAIATGLAVVASQFQPARDFQELQKTVDELAGAPGRPSRSDRGQHHAVVTPRVEASPDRSDFARLGETIAASWYRRRRNTPSSSLTTFDPKSLVVN